MLGATTAPGFESILVADPHRSESIFLIIPDRMGNDTDRQLLVLHGDGGRRLSAQAPRPNFAARSEVFESDHVRRWEYSRQPAADGTPVRIDFGGQMFELDRVSR